MNRNSISNRCFSFLLTANAGEVIDALCVALPRDRFVTYEPSDLDWMVPLEMADIIQLPESLITEVVEKISRSLSCGESRPQSHVGNIEVDCRIVHSHVCERCHNVRPLPFLNYDYIARYFCEDCLRLFAEESLRIPAEIIESAESSSYSSASVVLKQWETGTDH